MNLKVRSRVAWMAGYTFPLTWCTKKDCQRTQSCTRCIEREDTNISLNPPSTKKVKAQSSDIPPLDGV